MPSFATSASAFAPLSQGRSSEEIADAIADGLRSGMGSHESKSATAFACLSAVQIKEDDDAAAVKFVKHNAMSASTFAAARVARAAAEEDDEPEAHHTTTTAGAFASPLHTANAQALGGYIACYDDGQAPAAPMRLTLGERSAAARATAREIASGAAAAESADAEVATAMK